MKFTVIVEDSIIGIDGEFRPVVLPNLSSIRAIQFNNGSGHIEFNNAPNKAIGNLDLFQNLIQLWYDAAPPVPATPTLAERRELVMEQIKGYRNSRTQNGGYLVAGKWFHSDQASRTQQIALVMLGAAVPPVLWKTMDGSFVTMSQALAAAIFQAAINSDMAIFSVAETHINTVANSSNPETHNITTGWPAVFGE
jgi:hypothetical protein